MKKDQTIRFPGIPWYLKISKTMKLLVLILTCSCLTLSAETMAQQQRVTLNLKDCSVTDLFYVFITIEQPKLIRNIRV